MQRSTVGIAVLLVAVAIGLAVSGVVPEPGVEPDQGAEPEPPSVPEGSLIPVDGDYAMWPYTSRERSAEGRTLAINVVFRDDPATVTEALRDGPGTDWEEPPDADVEDADVGEALENASDANATTDAVADAGQEVIEDAVTTDWQRAHGSTRYTYFEHEGGHGTWVTETAQLHTGTYLGTRTHIRVYGSPDGAYTTLQAHGEYYDWFRLRHTVTHVSESPRTIEDDFIESGAEVTREYRGIEGGRSDGWVTVIDLGAVLPFIAVLLRRQTRRSLRRAGTQLRAAVVRHRHVGTLIVGLTAIVLGVRAAGIAFEAAYPGVSPKIAAAPLYLTLVVGLPAIVWMLADRCDADAAVAGTAIGLGGGFLLDVAFLGVAVPPSLIAHRTAVVAAAGLIAFGRADTVAGRRRSIVVLGLISWVLVLALPLADVI
ncbi:hypothetical protein [Halopenitus sp. POP-27]|uniref:hypothetical protein n=1 Tax=Halopenitus sp. POP-27 TaxID=2994425 RepID=UPI002468DC98|nr:hypothetical protein [Halopenitus sp. POP-27]